MRALPRPQTKGLLHGKTRRKTKTGEHRGKKEHRYSVCMYIARKVTTGDKGPRSKVEEDRTWAKQPSNPIACWALHTFTYLGVAGSPVAERARQEGLFSNLHPRVGRRPVGRGTLARVRAQQGLDKAPGSLKAAAAQRATKKTPRALWVGST